MSVLIDNGIYALDQKTSCFTVLLRSGRASCRAPSAPILFHLRLRVVSVYIIDNGVYAVDQKKRCLTVLFCSARARCCAPLAPILLSERSRVVSVYIDP